MASRESFIRVAEKLREMVVTGESLNEYGLRLSLKILAIDSSSPFVELSVETNGARLVIKTIGLDWARDSSLSDDDRLWKAMVILLEDGLLSTANVIIMNGLALAEAALTEIIPNFGVENADRGEPKTPLSYGSPHIEDVQDHRQPQ